MAHSVVNYFLGLTLVRSQRVSFIAPQMQSFSNMKEELHTRPYSLYPGLPVILLPSQNFKSWAVWQNENHSVAAKPRTSQQGATLKSCSHNIKADMAPLP